MTPWINARLGEICEVSIGRTPSRDRPEYWGRGYPWLSIADMNQGRELKETKESITERAVDECNCKPVDVGTVLLSFKLSIGKVGVAHVPLFTNEAIASLPIRDHKRITTDYLYWGLRSADLTRGLDRAAKGLTLNKAKLIDVEIPLPPLPEQRRIADILDRADALRAKRRAALKLLDELKSAIFLEMFGESECHDWQSTSIAQLANREPNSIRTGPFGSQLLHSEFTESGVAVLGIDNAVNNEFAWSERRYISAEKYEKLRRYTVKPGDVLVTIMGTCGKCAIVPNDVPIAINTKHLCCITLDRSKALPEFIHSYFLIHPVAGRYLAKATKGAIMSGLNMGIVSGVPVYLPPIELQREYVNRVAQLTDLRTMHRASLSHLNALFASLQHRAFRGEL